MKRRRRTNPPFIGHKKRPVARSVNPSCALICPSGANHPSADFVPVQSCPQKYSLSASGKSNLQLPPSRPTEGRLAIVTDAGRDAVDAGGTQTNGADADEI